MRRGGRPTLMARMTEFARSEQGKKLIRRATDYARSEQGQRQIKAAQERLAAVRANRAKRKRAR
jgi:hypothetical protein